MDLFSFLEKMSETPAGILVLIIILVFVIGGFFSITQLLRVFGQTLANARANDQAQVATQNGLLKFATEIAGYSAELNRTIGTIQKSVAIGFRDVEVQYTTVNTSVHDEAKTTREKVEQLERQLVSKLTEISTKIQSGITETTAQLILQRFDETNRRLNELAEHLEDKQPEAETPVPPI